MLLQLPDVKLHVPVFTSAEALAAEVDRLRQERQQLLQRLLEANEQITDLHDELGPAILRGSPTRRGSSMVRASRVRQQEEGARGTGKCSSHSGGFPVSRYHLFIAPRMVCIQTAHTTHSEFKDA